MPHPLDDLAKDLFARALLDNQAGELLECLYEGGAATIDAQTRKLVFITEDHLKQFSSRMEDCDEGAHE